MESQVTFCRQENICGASQNNNIAAFSKTNQVDGDSCSYFSWDVRQLLAKQLQ